VLSALPRFSPGAYGELLDSFHDAGWAVEPVTAMPGLVPRSVYVRHDIDFHLARIEQLAVVEADRGVRASYFALLTGPYNVFDPHNSARLRALVDMGHEVGLHYDLTTYPDDLAAARSKLAWECGVLSEVAGAEVRAICMHQPSLLEDALRQEADWVHPHDPRWSRGLLYVSDSYRRWRDDSMLDCFGVAPPERLLLNTHPELWLDGSIRSWRRYLEEVILQNVTGPSKDYVQGTVRVLWERAAASSKGNAR
jgi:hypothetical protein